MPSTLAQKLKIAPGSAILPVHAPRDFKEKLGALPEGVTIQARSTNPDQIHWFVKTQAEVNTEMPRILDILQEGKTCWIYYPKGSSGIQTDLTRDKGWDVLQARKELKWLSLISFDDTWSAFAVRKESGAESKKRTVAPRAILSYIDPAAKTVSLPSDLAAAFKKAVKSRSFFKTLSFTNKKEYVEWVVSAKREETRATRVAETISRLEKGWKNPNNR